MIKSIFRRHRASSQNSNFKMVLSVFLVLIMLVLSIPVNATNTKTMSITIGEGGVDQSSLSRSITIPNLKSIESVSVDTGSVSFAKNGENVTLDVSDGAISRSVPNPTKYSKTATDYSINISNSFSSTKSYSDAQGYSGTLSKDGTATSSSSSAWTTIATGPTGTKKSYIDTEFPSIDTPSSFKLYMWTDNPLGSGSKSVWYEEVNGPGYNNTVTTKAVYGTNEITEPLRVVTTAYIKVNGNYRISPSIITTDVRYGGWSNGVPILTAVVNESDLRRKAIDLWGADVEYGVTSSYVEQYKATTTYTQKYSGTVYKAGMDNYYKYTVTIEYIDNSLPELLSLTIEPKRVSEVAGYNIINVSGTLRDLDVGNSLSVYYKIGDDVPILATTLTADGNIQSFNFTINANDLNEETLNVFVWVDDGL